MYRYDKFLVILFFRIMEILPGGKMIDKITTYDEYLASDATAAKRQAILDLNTEEQDD